MSAIDTAFIAALKQEIARHRAHSIERIIEGTADPKQYGYACGYVKALDDMVRARGEGPQDGPGIIDQVLEDIQER